MLFCVFLLQAQADPNIPTELEGDTLKVPEEKGSKGPVPKKVSAITNWEQIYLFSEVYGAWYCHHKGDAGTFLLT